MQAKVGLQAILQARCGSTRLPYKIFEMIGNKPALLWVVDRLKRVKPVERIVVATTMAPVDDRVERFALDEGVECFRGSETDVLDRFVKTVESYPADSIVRATGDNPLLDSGFLELMIAEHVKTGADHTSVAGVAPIGVSAEVVRVTALETAGHEAVGKPRREHVTPFIYGNPERFNIIKLDAPDYLAGHAYRFTLDTADDLAALRAIQDRLSKTAKPFDAKNATRLLDSNPEVSRINSHVKQKRVENGDQR